MVEGGPLNGAHPIQRYATSKTPWIKDEKCMAKMVSQSWFDPLGWFAKGKAIVDDFAWIQDEVRLRLRVRV